MLRSEQQSYVIAPLSSIVDERYTAYFEWISPRGKGHRLYIGMKRWWWDKLETMGGPVVHFCWFMFLIFGGIFLSGVLIAACVAACGGGPPPRPAAPAPPSSQQAKLSSKDIVQPPVVNPAAVTVQPSEASAVQSVQESAPQQPVAECTASPSAITDGSQLAGSSSALTAPSSTQPSGRQAGDEKLALQPRKPDLAGERSPLLPASSDDDEDGYSMVKTAI
jgi:hypothetical protein